MGSGNSRRQFPNAKLRLRIERDAPALPKRETFMDIVMDGTRFHVSDESGAHPSDILGDVRAPRGLGRTPGSLEEIMDINSDWRRGPVAEHPTELYGDLASTEGWVRDRRLKEWSLPARELAPV